MRMMRSKTMSDSDLDSYLRVPLIDQFMRPYQYKAKDFGDAPDEVMHVMVQLSKVINDARDPLRSNNASNKARERSQ